MYLRIIAFVAISFMAVVHSHAEEVMLGGDLDELLASLAKNQPALHAARHAEEAAANEAIVAGALEDPKFAVRFEDIDERNIVPNRLGTVYYDFSQSIPLGGKRDARRALAEVEIERARKGGILDLAELQYQMRMAYVRRYLALEKIHLIGERQAILRNIAGQSGIELEQGSGKQQDLILADIEVRRVQEDLINAEGEAQREEARINILLGRPVNTPLALPKSLPALPSEAALNLPTLLDRLGREAPDLQLPQTDIIAAERERDLAKTNWWPDLDLRGSIVDRNGEAGGYEAQIGLNVPLQWGLRRAQEQAAISKLAAASDRQEDLRRRLAAQLQDAYWGLVVANRHEKVIREDILPRWQIAIENARQSYSAGQASINDVLNALQNLKQTEQDHLAIRLEQQDMLAQLQRAMGGSL